MPWRGELPCRLVVLALVWLILEDQRSELETKAYVSTAATCFAVQCSMTVFDDHVGLGVLAVLAQNGVCVRSDSLGAWPFIGTIDDPTTVGGWNIDPGTTADFL